MVPGTCQFPSVIPGVFFALFSKEVEEEKVMKKKATPLIFFLRHGIYVYVCVCMYSVYYFVIPIIFFPPKFAVIFSPEGASGSFKLVSVIL